MPAPPKRTPIVVRKGVRAGGLGAAGAPALLALPALLRLLPLLTGICAAPDLCAQAETLRVSITSAGEQVAGGGIWAAPSADGRFVAFLSHSDELVAADDNLERDAFVHDRLTGLTERVSLNDAGEQQDLGGFQYGLPAISGDGRCVAFDSPAFNLTALDTHGVYQSYVRDRLLGTTRCVSVSTAGECADADAGDPRLSVDGRFVAFTSAATNLEPADDDGPFALDVFVHDRRTGLTQELSWGLGRTPVAVSATLNDLSDDGRFVTFHSFGSSFVAHDDNGATDVFLHDRRTGLTELVSLSSWGRQAHGTSAGSAVSADGRYVVFTSEAADLVPHDSNGVADVFRRDRWLGTTTRVSVAADGGQADGQSQVFALSSDGRFAMLQSAATNLLPGDDNGDRDLFRKDLRTGAIERVNVSSAGVQAVPGSATVGSHCTPDGEVIGFMSKGAGLVAGDTNGGFDGFVHDRGGPWMNAGGARAGLHGDPFCYATGTLVAGEPLTLRLVNAREQSYALLWVATGLPREATLERGPLSVGPPLLLLGGFTDVLGQIVLPASGPALPAGTVLGLQWLVRDAAASGGFALSNAVGATLP